MTIIMVMVLVVMFTVMVMMAKTEVKSAIYDDS